MSDEKIKIRLRTKHGRTFRRFGVVIGPDAPVELEVTREQLRALEADCAPLDRGGVLTVEIVEPPAKKPVAGDTKPKA